MEDQGDEAEKPSNPELKLKGPYFRYEKRLDELFFDLKQKYLLCPICGAEISILDFQVLVDDISSTLSPEKARKFSMKIMGLYRDSPAYAIEVLAILGGDFQTEEESENDYLEELEGLIETHRGSAG